METAKQILLHMMTSTEKIFESAKSEKKPILCNHGLSCMYSKSFLLFFLEKIYRQTDQILWNKFIREDIVVICCTFSFMHF